MITGSVVEHFSYSIAFYLSAVVCGLGSIGCLYLHLFVRKGNKSSVETKNSRILTTSEKENDVMPCKSEKYITDFIILLIKTVI